MRTKWCLVILILCICGIHDKAGAQKAAVSKPLYSDPIHDGAADPVVIWNPHTKMWWMFYTNRRANSPDTSGVEWVHGTRIGIAASKDGSSGATLIRPTLTTGQTRDIRSGRLRSSHIMVLITCILPMCPGPSATGTIHAPSFISPAKT
jgi:hypothetical protein